jgi:hypothetical protein
LRFLRPLLLRPNLAETEAQVVIRSMRLRLEQVEATMADMPARAGQQR